MLVFAIVAIVVLAIVADARVSPSLVVQTSMGLVQGHLSIRVKTVAEFLGIPFAEAPVGTSMVSGF